MILRGILDRSLGNMVCIRGFAKMGDLAQVSKVDESYQRDLIKSHKYEVLDFLHKQETLLCTLGYQKIQGAVSRIKFYHQQRGNLINLHKSHPNNILKVYLVK